MAGFSADGTEGVAFYPSLNATEFVTKLFYNEEDYNDALLKTAAARSVLGEDLADNGTSMIPLEGVAEVNIRARPNVHEKFYNVHGVSTNSPIFAVKMPYLGVDIVALVNDDTAYIRDVRTLLVQIIKLFTQINKLNTNRYFHRDIRLPNITIIPDTTELFIIDYGMSRKAEEVENNFVYVHYPPEYLLTDFVSTEAKFKIAKELFHDPPKYEWTDEDVGQDYYKKSPKFKTQSREIIKNLLYKQICEYSSKYAKIYDISDGAGEKRYNLIMESFKSILIEQVDDLKTKINSLYTFDSFPLAVSLLILFEKVLLIEEEDVKLANDIQAILRELCDVDVYKRIDASEALARFYPLTVRAKGGRRATTRRKGRRSMKRRKTR